MSRRGLGCDNLYHLLPRTKNSVRGAVILEGHRIFAFPGYADLATTIIYLTATDKLLFERGTEARSIRKHKLFLSNVLDQLQKSQQDDHSGGRKIAGLLGVPGLTNRPPRGRGYGRINLSADIELDGRWTF